MNSHDGIELSFSGGNSNSHCYVFCTRAMYPITINTFIDISVFAKDGTPNSMIIYTIVKIVFQNLKTNSYQVFVTII